MTEEAQRIAIAEFCGWKKNANSFGHTQSMSKGGVTINNVSMLPNYPQDLNAMHEAEKMLSIKQIDVYIGTLKNIVVNRELVWHFDLLHATASQRTEALLRTIGKWKE